MDNTHGYDAKTFSRYLKMNPFEVLSEYDFSVYIDGSIEIRKTIKKAKADPENVDAVMPLLKTIEALIENLNDSMW